MLVGGGSTGPTTGGDTGTMWTQQPPAAGPDRGLPGWDGVDAIVVLLVGAAALKTRLSDLPIASLIVAGLWVLLGALAVKRLVQRFGSAWLTWTLTRQPALSALLILAFASCLWSLDPTLTVRTAAALLGTTIVGVFIGYSWPPTRLMRVLFWMFVLLIGSSIVAALVIPTPVGPGIPLGWQGVLAHKNSLGAAALFASLYFLVITVRSDVRPLWGAMLCTASLFTLIQSHSETSLVALGLTFLLAGFLGVGSLTRRPLGAILGWGSLGLVFIVAVVPFFIGPFASALGNVDPLHGRTLIWEGVLTILRERPMTGYGYGVVWGRSTATLLPHIRVTALWESTSAHNSILHVASELGFPGAIVACAYLFAALHSAGRLFAQRRTAFSTFAFLFVVAVALVGFMEALLLRSHPFWVIFVAMTVAVTRSLESDARPTKVRQDESPEGETRASRERSQAVAF